MNRTIHRALAVALAAGATIAYAQDQPAFVKEPTASVAAGSNSPEAGAIAQALNDDASLQGSKLTVVPDANAILITGATPTLQQKVKVANIATQAANGADVVSIVKTDELWLDARRFPPES